MPKLFARAGDAPVGQHFAAGLLQSSVMWGIFLVAIPAAVAWAQDIAGLPRFDSTSLRPLIIVAFIGIGSSCIYCTWLFAREGLGTPAPFAAPKRLVLSGPYRHVRNPMAIAGIAQGILVGLFLGSWPAVAYALIGAGVWNSVARPAEERDLAAHYGEPYERYSKAVRCWIPSLRPYNPEA